MSSPAIKQPSFEDLVVAALPKVKAFAISLTRDATRGEDVAQETMLKALTYKAQFQEGTNIDAWLFTICKNLVYSASRKRRELEDTDGSAEASLKDESAVGEEALGDEAELTQKLIQALPKPMQEAIQDVSQGLTYADVAEKRGIGVGTVKSRLSRAREQLGLVGGRRTRGADTAKGSAASRKRLRGVGGLGAGTFRKVDVSVFKKPEFQTELAALPKLLWLPITQLRIDETYQRKIQEHGIGNIYRIARNFDWKKFSAVVVAKIEGAASLYAIVDGQHRSYAALLRGVEEVPCLVIEATQQEQADSFAAINSKTTQVSKLNVFAATVAAGDPEAVAITKACTEANVSICRYPQHEADMKPRETIAIGAVTKVYREHGAKVLTLALKCILQPHYHECGVLREPLIKGMAAIVAALDEKRPAAMLASAEAVNFQRVLVEAKILAAQKGYSTHKVVYELLLPKFK